jgi:7-carboxy-7-deazaguanine synthase
LLDDESYAPLQVNEVFFSIQGEAFYTGTPATFIRLQGCDVGCPWCDTKFTWSTAAQPVEPGVVLAKEHSASPQWTWMTWDALLNLTTRHTIFTGGEPAMQGAALGPLLHYLKEHSTIDDLTVQIETSGTYPLDWCPGWVWGWPLPAMLSVWILCRA